MRGVSLSEIDLDHIMQQEFTATCTDGDIARFGQGTPHARFYGTMARKIRRYVLDRNVITLPFAIRSMTSLAAQIMGLATAAGPARLLRTSSSSTTRSKTSRPSRPPVSEDSVRVRQQRGRGGRRKLTKAVPGKVVTPRAAR
jgi:hypothetical protein